MAEDRDERAPYDEVNELFNLIIDAFQKIAIALGMDMQKFNEPHLLWSEVPKILERIASLSAEVERLASIVKYLQGHYCKPPLGNPTREEAIARADRAEEGLRKVIQVATDDEWGDLDLRFEVEQIAREYLSSPISDE